jgi:hypothetical protein
MWLNPERGFLFFKGTGCKRRISPEPARTFLAKTKFVQRLTLLCSVLFQMFFVMLFLSH